MGMHNPPHPGEFITEVYLEPNHLSGRGLAAKLGVGTGAIQRRARRLGLTCSKKEAGQLYSKRYTDRPRPGDLMPRGSWVTAEADAYILAHYNVDKTTMQIAEHLGVRQTQVASRARDLGLQKSRYYGERKQAHSARLERMAKVAARVDDAERSESIPPVPSQPYTPAPPRSSKPYRIGGTSPWKTCQFIPGSDRVKCGCPSKPGYSWCHRHYAVVFHAGTALKQRVAA